jgi:hypothetical protein
MALYSGGIGLHLYQTRPGDHAGMNLPVGAIHELPQHCHMWGSPVAAFEAAGEKCIMRKIEPACPVKSFTGAWLPLVRKEFEMTLADQIQKYVKQLPPEKQSEVLDFAAFLQ